MPPVLTERQTRSLRKQLFDLEKLCEDIDSRLKKIELNDATLWSILSSDELIRKLKGEADAKC